MEIFIPNRFNPVNERDAEILFFAGTIVYMIVKAKNKSGKIGEISVVLTRDRETQEPNKNLFYQKICRKKREVRQQGFEILDRNFMVEL